MNRILIVNQGNTENYGDIAINDTIKVFLEKNNNKVDFISFWCEEKIFKSLYKENSFLYRLIFKIPYLTDIFYRRYLKKCVHNKKYDYVIIGGGELLSSHKGFNNAMYNITSYFYKKAKINIIGVSGNDDMKSFYKKRYKKSLQKCDKIYVRDSFTKEMCQNLYKVDAEQWPDVVFAYKKVLNLNYDQVEKQNQVVFIPIMYFNEINKNLKLKNKEEYYQFLSHIVKKNIEPKDTLIITTTVSEDQECALEMYHYLSKIMNNKIFLKKYTNLQDYIELLKTTRLVISARMHGLILAKIYKCKIKTIVFKRKLEVFRKEYENIDDILKIEEDALKSLEQII